MGGSRVSASCRGGGVPPVAFFAGAAPKQGQPPAPHEGQSLARIISVGTGKETGHRYSAEPYRGDGLAEAFETLFDAVPPNQPKVRCVYAGFNGEEMPAKEWGVARLRNSERFADEVQVEHPADCIGNTGAAMGAIMLALVISGGHTPEPRPIWARDDPGPTGCGRRRTGSCGGGVGIFPTEHRESGHGTGEQHTLTVPFGDQPLVDYRASGRRAGGDDEGQAH